MAWTMPEWESLAALLGSLNPDYSLIKTPIYELGLPLLNSGLLKNEARYSEI